MVEKPAYTSEKIPNPVKKTAVVWWIITGVLIAGVFWPYLLTGEARQWGFGVSFLCIVFGITSLIIAVIYTRRARIAERMLHREDILVHWTFTPEQWRIYAEREHEKYKQEKKNVFLAVLIITVIICGLLAVMLTDSWQIFVVTGTGIILMMSIATWLAVWMRNHQNRAVAGEVFISASGVFLNRELHIWHGFGAVLEDITYQQEKGEMLLLNIIYSVPNRYNRQSVNVRVPVPAGAEDSAGKVVEMLRAHFKK